MVSDAKLTALIEETWPCRDCRCQECGHAEKLADALTEARDTIRRVEGLCSLKPVLTSIEVREALNPPPASAFGATKFKHLCPEHGMNCRGDTCCCADKHTLPVASEPAAKRIRWCKWELDDGSICPREAIENGSLCAEHAALAEPATQPQAEARERDDWREEDRKLWTLLEVMKNPNASPEYLEGFVRRYNDAILAAAQTGDRQ